MSDKHLEAIELLKKDYELGIFTKEEYEIELNKLGVYETKESNLDYVLIARNHLEVFRHIEAIRSNLKPIAKMILESKWGQKDVDDNKIIVVCGQHTDTFKLFSITYINKYGQFIEIDLSDIVSYIDKIDFDDEAYI